jgi:hypothetical protein
VNVIVVAAIVVALVLVLAYIEWASRRHLRWPSDAECIDIMRQGGADLSKARTLEFHLHFPSRQVAIDAERAVVAAGYEAQVCAGPGAPHNLLVARKSIMPTKAELLVVRKQLVALSRKYGGTYQGCSPRA